MDPVGVLEAVHAADANAGAWLAGVACACADLLGRERPMIATYVEPDDERGVRLSAVLQRSSDADICGFVREVTPQLSAEDFARTYGSPQIFESLRVRAGRTYTPSHWLFTAFRQRFGVDDFDLLRVVAPAGQGVMIGAGREGGGRPSRREKARWARLAPHVAGGLRLRAAIARERPAEPVLERSAVEAVLDPGGGVVAATGLARPRAAREELRTAARAIERARSSAGRRDPERAIEGWQALVAGRWALIDVFDSDGRRFIIARENRPRPAALVPLTRRELDVLELIQRGLSNKRVALTLGLSESTVSEHLMRAREKLGARSAVELARRAT
jgi:DNA-binding CsgD family transcriptional regulator